MSDLESVNFSEVAANNNAASPNGAPEGMAPSGVNDTIREVMAANKRWWDRDHPTVTSGGSANAQTLTYTVGPTSYVQGQAYSFIAGFSNSGATTLNVNGLGIKNVTKQGSISLAGGEILAGAVVTVMYDGTQFQLTDGVLSSSPAGVGQAPTSGGSANVQTVTYSPAVTAYSTGQQLSFVAGFSNTGATTVNINGLGAKNVFMDGAALVGGEIQLNQTVEITYDGTEFQIVSGRPAQSTTYGFRNALYNGGCEVWQRGAGGSASMALAASSNGYTADRWTLTTGVNEAFTVSQQAGLTNGSQWCARLQRNSGQTGTAVIYWEQPLTLEQIVPLRGKIVSLQFVAATGANWSPSSGNLLVNVYCGTGVAGRRAGSAYTSETNPITKTIALAQGASAAAQSAVATIVVPTTTTQMTVQFSWTPVGTASTNDWVSLDEIQLEIGGGITTFERRPIDLELAQCQRFYRKSFPYATAPAQNAGTAGVPVVGQTALGGTHYILASFGILMRAAGTVTTFNPSVANAQARNIDTALDCSSTSGTAAETGIVLSFTSPGSGSGGTRLACHYTVDAEI